MKDYYKTLGIDKNSDDLTIKKAYKKLAMKFHPDRVQNEKEKEEYTNKFKDIGEAYDILSDPNKKKIYDTYGEEGLNGTGGGSNNGGGNYSSNFSSEGAEEIFKKFFSGSNFSNFSNFNGNSSEGFSNFNNSNGSSNNNNGFNFKNFTNFNNSSDEDNSSDDFSNFFTKNKKQKKETLKKSEPMTHVVNVTLEDLYNQKTKKIKINRKIQNNLKNIIEEKVLTFDLKPGCKEGTKIKFEKEGDQLFGFEGADVIFTLSFKKHKFFNFEKKIKFNLYKRNFINLCTKIKYFI